MAPKTKEQYVRQILRRIRVTDGVKRRIRADLLADIAAKQDAGQTLAQIQAEMGSPDRAAAEFNAAYDGTPRPPLVRLAAGRKSRRAGAAGAGRAVPGRQPGGAHGAVWRQRRQSLAGRTAPPPSMSPPGRKARWAAFWRCTACRWHCWRWLCCAWPPGC